MRTTHTPRHRRAGVGTLLLALVIAMLAFCATASAQGGADALRRDAIADLERARAVIVERDALLEGVCGSRCAGPVLRKAAADLRALDRRTLRVLDAALARLAAGHQITQPQAEALLHFGDREPLLLDRLQLARRVSGPADDGSTAFNLGRAIGRLVGAVVFYIGLPVGLFLLVRRLVRRRRLSMR